MRILNRIRVDRPLVTSLNSCDLPLIAERISDRQIIVQQVQQVQRYSRVLVCMYVCMYVCMSTKNSGLSIVGSVKHAACALRCACHPYYHKLSPMKNV